MYLRLVIDFIAKTNSSQPTFIMDEKVECVESYKYLGTIII